MDTRTELDRASDSLDRTSRAGHAGVNYTKGSKMATDQMRGVGATDAGTESDRLTAQVQQQMQEKAQDVKGQASDKAREEIDSRSTALGEHVHSLGQALRRSVDQLDGEGRGAPAGIARQAAAQVERLGLYLKDSSSDRFLNDVESFGRGRPWAAGGVGALVGFAASRFLKASSGRALCLGAARARRR
jgi:hypothetical protein